MWFIALLILAAIGFIGLKLYRIETDHPFQNPQTAAVPKFRSPASAGGAPLSGTVPAALEPVNRAANNPTTEVKRFSGFEKFLTRTEMAWFETLRRSLPSDCQIFAKVRMADLLEPVAETPAARRKALEEVAREKIDFVICRTGTWKIEAVLVAEDGSRPLGRSLEEIFAQTAYPLIRLPSKELPVPEEVVDKIQKLFARHEHGDLRPIAEPGLRSEAAIEPLEPRVLAAA